MGSENAKSVLGFILKSYIRTGRRVVGDCNVRSRNEFVAEALKFYMGYLLAGKAENYFLQSLASVLTGTVQDSENRLARMDFKDSSGIVQALTGNLPTPMMWMKNL